MSKTRFRKLIPLVTTLALIVPLLLALAAPVSAATITVCASGCDYTTIQAAVDAANDGDVIDVYPGTYNESVDLNGMSPDGDITIRSVNSGGTPTAGTATVNGGAAGPAFETTSTFSGDVTIDGFIVKSTNDDGIDVGVNSDVVIRDVTANATGESGIEVDEASGNVTIEDCTANDNDGNGFYIYDVGGNLTVRRCTANDNGQENFEIEKIGGNVTIIEATAHRAAFDEGGIDVEDVGGNVKITDSTANDNPEVNIEVVAVDGDVTVKRCTANGSADGEGILIGEFEVENARDHGIVGNVTIEDCTANDNDGVGIEVSNIGGNVRIDDCTANGNGSDGIYLLQSEDLDTSSGSDDDHELQADVDVEEDDDADDVEKQGVTPSANGGNVTITNCTANENEQSGFDPEGVEGTVTIKACIARDNDSGVDLDDMRDADAVLLNGNIICGNECGVGLWSDIADLNLEGNWWGCDGGPEAAGCDPICQRDSIPVGPFVTPWIDTVTASAPASVIVGEPAIVSFQFSGGPPAVYLGKGPGDLRGPAPFTVTTDNGTVTGGFINAPHGVMEVTLVPDHDGSATVTVVGPCGLDEQIVLGVQAAAADFVPEPGSVVLLASGLMGLAGYAGLRMRKK